MKILFEAGYRVITCFHSVALPQDSSSKYPSIELQKANNILAVINAKNLTKVHLVTHSEGALNVTIAAQLQPQFISSLILLTPAGLIGKDNLVALGWRFLIFLLNTNTLSVIRNVTRKGRKHVNFWINLKCGLAEGNAMVTTSIANSLKDIRTHGIKVAIIPGEQDNVFPKEKMSRVLGEDCYDLFVTKLGGHEVYTISDVSMKVVKDVLMRI